jgi:serine/threonine protein kinase
MPNLIGHSLGRYHILEQLGEGGMAIVYKARDTRLEADVAVKIIRTDSLPGNAIERTLKRFEREARALARLTHPNIVKVTDYGEHEGKPYLVMPLLSGGTLKSKLNGKPMPWQDAMKILIPIADALGYAHKHDIIHRDVKPANILITENGQPMLADFGVAKMLDVEETMELTGTGVGIGTPEYMAPEQVTNKQMDARADIYALGVVLFEMVTGRKPFIADTPMAVLIMHSRDPLPRPKSFAPNLPQAVENIIIKSLAKKPEDRFQNMADFAQAMEGLIGGKKFSDPIVNKDEKRAEFKLPAIPRRAAITVGLIALGIGLLAAFSFSLKSLPTTLFPTATPSDTSTPELTLTASNALKSEFTSTPSGTPTLLFTARATSIPTQITDAKGVSMRLVPAGEFTMGADEISNPVPHVVYVNGKPLNEDLLKGYYKNTKPIHQVYLDTFYVDKYKVSNALYKVCVDAGACSTPKNTNHYNDPAYAKHPVIVVWNSAEAYCEWRGGRLPTEAEWEKAARGTDGRSYPWGVNSGGCSRANVGECAKGDTTKVDSYPEGVSPYGLYDMAGNVGEWVADWYSETYYQISPASNPLGPSSGQYHILRGGTSANTATTYHRTASPNPNDVGGFRCAVSASDVNVMISTPSIMVSPTPTK